MKKLARKETDHIPVTTSPLTVSSVHLFQNLQKTSKEDGNLLGDFLLASTPPLYALKSSGGKRKVSKSIYKKWEGERERETQNHNSLGRMTSDA